MKPRVGVAVKVLLKTVLPVIVGLVVLVLVVAFLAGVFRKKIEPGENVATIRRPDPDRKHEIYEVREIVKAYDEEAVGTLKAASRTEISARIMAPINEVHVSAGQAVRTGDVLIELDRRALKTRLAQAEASLAAAQATLAQAENNYSRAAQLFQKRIITKSEMDQATADVKAARAALSRAQQAVGEVEVLLSYTTIKAPKDGVIVDRLAEEGDMARPGDPLLVLYDPTSLRLEAPVMENLVGNLKPGDELTVQIDARDNRRVTAVVDEIVPQAEAASRSFLVKVKLPRSDDLFEGMFGRLKIPAGTRRHLCLNTGAIRTIGQLQFVDVLGFDGSLERRFIKTGRYGDANHREVLSGLKAGDRVLLHTPSDDPE